MMGPGPGPGASTSSHTLSDPTSSSSSEAIPGMHLAPAAGPSPSMAHAQHHHPHHQQPRKVDLTLADMCKRTIIRRLNDYESFGNLPFRVLQPILERATPRQLYRMEQESPHLIEGADYIWKRICFREFPEVRRSMGQQGEAGPSSSSPPPSPPPPSSLYAPSASSSTSSTSSSSGAASKYSHSSAAPMMADSSALRNKRAAPAAKEALSTTTAGSSGKRKRRWRDVYIDTLGKQEEVKRQAAKRLKERYGQQREDKEKSKVQIVSTPRTSGLVRRRGGYGGGGGGFGGASASSGASTTGQKLLNKARAQGQARTKLTMSAGAKRRF